MTKKLLAFAVALSFVVITMAHAEEKAPKKASPAKTPKVSETRLHEADFVKLENVVAKGVVDGMRGGASGWEYMAKSMKPPKNDKWLGRWNELGAEGWEAFDHFENIYIFKRPAYGTKTAALAPVDKKAEKKAQKEKDKAEKQAEKDKAKADKEAEKAAKKAEKEQEKAVKKAEKASKKAEKDAEKAAKKAK